MPKAKTTSKDNIWIEMNTLPTAHVTNEQKRAIIAKVAKKFNVEPGKVRFTTKKIYPTGVDGTSDALNSENIQNVHDPRYHLELFKDYIKENGITDYNWNEIVNIDSRVNARIDFDSYEKGRRFELKYAKWKNFLSYGDDNFFDFTKLHGLVLLHGEPANKSGKSTFAYDLIHFALFGKTRSGKADTKAEIFNNYRPEEREVVVELGISIDGENYVIKRTLTKPDPKKKTKTISNCVEYYRVHENGDNEKLQDVDNLQDESSTKTTKAIMEAIGSEEDFDRIISANAKDLDELISMKDTDRGRVLSRWIGLMPIEDKEIKAKEMWGRESVGRTCDRYDRETLSDEIKQLQEENEEDRKKIEANKEKIAEASRFLERDHKAKDMLLSSKESIDETLLKVDVATVERKKEDLTNEGKKAVIEQEQLIKEVEGYGDVEYSDEVYKGYMAEKEKLSNEMASMRVQITHLREQNKSLAEGEFCITCGRRYDDIDNGPKIAENQRVIAEITQRGMEYKARVNELTALILELDTKRNLFIEKNKKSLKIEALKTRIANLRNEYKEYRRISEDYQKNKDAIARNNEIDAQVNVFKVNIDTYNSTIIRLENENVSIAKDIETNEALIKEKQTNIKKIEEEVEAEKNWRLYLNMIGKDGISKMVLRKTLPLINGELDNLLCDVADFGVEVEVNDRNDIEFWLVRDNVRTRLSGGSGLEKTMASLALRVVLGKMSNLSKPPFIVLDEILGSVAKENYDDMKKLYDKIALDYDYVLNICHIDLDWYDCIVTVKKTDNISTISMN